jgi:phosphoglycerate dehydrogenase-like enzyme
VGTVRRVTNPRIAVAPENVRSWLADAVRRGGGDVVPVEEAEALVWTEVGGADRLGALLAGPGAGLRWVQLPWAGIELFVPALDDRRIWTCGKGVYGEPVAEHALALLLAGFRQLQAYARAQKWSAPAGRNLLGANVVVVGGGGIADVLLRLLQPFGATVTVVRRHPSAEGGRREVGLDQLDAALEAADACVLAMALTPETAGLFDRRRLGLLGPEGWLVNVARGQVVVTDDLVAALDAGELGGAALDVTDPEPLPAGHPLWSRADCLLTPHTANTPEMAIPLLSGRVAENVRRWQTGEPLLGLVDVSLGY